MRKLILQLLAAVSIFASTASGTAAQEPAAVPSGFEDYVSENMHRWSMPGAAVAVIRDGETVYAKGFGVRQQGRDAAVDEHTLFGVASVTKMQIAAAVATLVTAGKLGYDDRVMDHLPNFRVSDPYVSSHVTVRDLLTHRSGIETYGDWVEEVPDLTAAEALERFHLLGQAQPFREGHHYNNSGFLVLGELISTVAGKPWQDFLVDDVWRPLGLVDSVASAHAFVRPGAILPTGDGWLDDLSIGSAALQDGANVAVPHTIWPAEFGGEVHYDPAELQNSAVHFHRSAIDASQSAYMSVHDLARWGEILIADALGEDFPISTAARDELVRVAGFHHPSLVAELDPADETLRGIGYAPGHEVYVFAGRALVGHSGGELGSAGILLVDPHREVGVAVAINNRLYSNHELDWVLMPLLQHLYGMEVDYGIVDRTLAKERAEQAENIAESANRIQANPPGKEEMRRLVGEYRHPFAGGIAVFRHGRDLVLSRGRSFDYVLLRADDERYVAIPRTPRRAGQLIRIERDTSGGVQAIRFGEDEDALRFERAQTTDPAARARGSMWHSAATR